MRVPTPTQTVHSGLLPDDYSSKERKTTLGARCFGHLQLQNFLIKVLRQREVGASSQVRPEAKSSSLGGNHSTYRFSCPRTKNWSRPPWLVAEIEVVC